MADSGYIGTKLSLISKSDIRYVGTLQNVDPQTSSIALAQVRSFGTEGRCGGRFEDEVPASTFIFEYIVFRGADVKDLQVFEAPPLPPPAPQAYASSQYATSHPYFYSYSMSTTAYMHPMTNQHYPMYPPPPPLPFTALSMSTMPMTQKPEATDNVTPKTIFSPTYPVPDTMTKIRTPLIVDNNNDDTSHITISKPDTKDSPSPSPRTMPVTTILYTELDAVTKVVNDLDIGKKGGSPRDGTTTEYDLKKTKDDSNQKITTDNSRPNKNTSSGNRNIKRKSKSKRTNTAKYPMLQQEFDFASSNAKFNKDTSQTDNLSVDAFYDKNKSFFDNISCDAKEKTECSNIKGYHKKHQNEKQLNFETFGPSSILLPRRKQARQGGRTNSMGRNNGK